MVKLSADEKRKLYDSKRAKEILEDAEYSAAFIALHYPQYSLADAVSMAVGDQALLIKTKLRSDIDRDITLASIIAASKDKRSYEKLIHKFEKELKNLK